MQRRIKQVLIGCEESQEVCKAFRALGYVAYSCDILECSGEHPEWHLQMDVFDAIELKKWDLAIFHPPCTYVCAGSMNWLYRQSGRFEKMLESVAFVQKLWNCGIPKICIENPIGVLSTRFMKPTQIIHTYQFGHPYKKDACYWLKNLPKLQPTNILPLPYKTFDFMSWDRLKENGGNKKSVTFSGIANAMANQWGELL
jgi:hypothetical protein